MKIVRHILPTRDLLQRLDTPGLPAQDEDIASLELAIRLLAASDLLRDRLFTPIEKDYGVSEGKLILLVHLYPDRIAGVTVLATRIGVATPTASIMVKRMLAADSPLIELVTDTADARQRRLRLTDEGRRLVEAILPEHFRHLAQAMANLTAAERETFGGLLHKILTCLADETSSRPSEHAARSTESSPAMAPPG